MSVENRIFWLLVGILALYLVFAARGRQAVNRFLFEVFGVGSTQAPAQQQTPATPQIQWDGLNPDEYHTPGVA